MPTSRSVKIFRRRPGSAGGQSAAFARSGVTLNPSEPTSNAQARINAIGKPASTKTMTNRAVQTGRVSAGSTVAANWMMSQPTTA